MRLRRFFIDVASRLVNRFIRRLRIRLAVGPAIIIAGASIIGGAAIIIVGEVSGFFSTVFVELSVLAALLLAEPDPELLAEAVEDFEVELGEEFDEEVEEELPTLLIVTLLTLRVPVFAAIRIRRVFSSAADITLLEYYI